MIDHYKVITFTHHLVDVSEIGHYQIQEEQTTTSNIKDALGIDEMIYLSTCNRVTYILYMGQDITIEFIQSLIKKANAQIEFSKLNEIENHVSVYEGLEAIQHIFEVAGSVDSLVVGESEIFRQFRQAYNQALDHGMIGDNLRLLEKITVQVAKRIYSHTRINEKPLSIAALAGQAIMQEFDEVSPRVALVGAGETNTLVGKFLQKHGFNHIDIYNRSLTNAEALAAIIKGNAYSLSELGTLPPYNIIVACTAAQHYIVTHEMAKKLTGGVASDVLFVDLAVPCNVDPSIINDLNNVKIIAIDQLKTLAADNLKFRKKEISLAKTIIEDAVLEFKNIFGQRQIEKAFSLLPSEVSNVKTKIKEEVFKDQLKSLSTTQMELLDEILNYMESKCIAIPMKLAKQAKV
jgi:glutamyl-tRNA reductase